MHHVAVSLDGHHVADLHRAHFRNTTDIVAMQIDQHDVLGPLFGISQQLGLQCPVLLRGCPAAPCTGQRTAGHLAIRHATKDLRARTNQRAGGALQIKHERRRVDDPQRPIDVERIGRAGHPKPLTRNKLKNIARFDVFLALANRRLEVVAGKLLS